MKENLKVLMLNGSPKANGNTAIALREMENVFKENGIEVENIVIGNQAVRGCIACGSRLACSCACRSWAAPWCIPGLRVSRFRRLHSS